MPPAGTHFRQAAVGGWGTRSCAWGHWGCALGSCSVPTQCSVLSQDVGKAKVCPTSRCLGLSPPCLQAPPVPWVWVSRPCGWDGEESHSRGPMCRPQHHTPPGGLAPCLLGVQAGPCQDALGSSLQVLSSELLFTYWVLKAGTPCQLQPVSSADWHRVTYKQAGLGNESWPGPRASLWAPGTRAWPSLCAHPRAPSQRNLSCLLGPGCGDLAPSCHGLSSGRWPLEPP